MMLVGSLEVPRKALLPEANSVKIRCLTHSEAEQINLLVHSLLQYSAGTTTHFSSVQVSTGDCTKVCSTRIWSIPLKLRS